MLFEADLEAAQARIADAVVRTPVWRSDELDAELGCSLFLKCEPLQRTGSFKLRGATNAIRSLCRAATTPRRSPTRGALPACR
jgi:threonine dehydratase